MGEVPNPNEVAASEKEAAAKKEKEAAAKNVGVVPAGPPIPTVDLTEPPTAAEDMISKANAAAARQEEANKELKIQVDRMEAMKVEQTLGGKADAGQPSQTEEEKADADARKLLEGTGMEDMAFPPPAEKK